MTGQPHFDDEWTVLTAQPVVPLERIKHKRRWFLGGAFAIAMLLGAACALISAYFKLRNVPEPEIEVSSVAAASEPAVEMSALPLVENIPEQPPTPLPKQPQPKVRHTDKADLRVTRPRLSEDEELRQIRAAVMVDEWQERRLRRVERRRRTQHHQRDLANIDEIFEGRARP